MQTPAWREIACDLADSHDCRRTLEAITAEGTAVDVLILNAAHLVIAPFLELSYEDFDASWKACVAGAIGCLQGGLPGMLRRGHGTVIISGATGSTRGSAKFAAFACAKFGLRALAQSLAREYQSSGVHVVHVVLDGLLRGSASVERFGRRGDCTLSPEEVSRMYRVVCEQPHSAWTHEVDFRAAGGSF
jgi:NAD(P)-dependent dehydrogenase (short-subunit alcohol dehydrogenase family)